MSRQIIRTEEAPAAIGPYCQAIRSDDWVFVSGQIPLTPSGQLVGQDIEQQARQVLKNIEAIVRKAGGSLDHVVKTTIYLTNLDDFSVVNRIYGSHFPDEPPARTTVGVVALPKGAQVEMDAIARIP